MFFPTSTASRWVVFVPPGGLRNASTGLAPQRQVPCAQCGPQCCSNAVSSRVARSVRFEDVSSYRGADSSNSRRARVCIDFPNGRSLQSVQIRNVFRICAASVQPAKFPAFGFVYGELRGVLDKTYFVDLNNRCERGQMSRMTCENCR